MARRTVVTMPGDGIGKTVLPEALRVLDAVGFDAEYVHGDVGWESWRREGNALPARTLGLLAQHELGLLGATTSKPKRECEAELAPELRGRGLAYGSPLIGMRQHFELDVCLRPCRSFEGNPLNFVRKTAAGGFEEPTIDVAVFRQNTEGMFSGIEWTDPPAEVRTALALHAKWQRFASVPGADLALSTRIATRPVTRRILRAAFEHARKHGYESVTLCEKPAVLRETSGMFEDEAHDLEKEFPDIELRSVNIDAQVMWLTKNPEDFGVIVCENLFGDIVSDAAAGLVGGLGFAASANYGADVAVFEPTHGSAPKYAAYPTSIVNPIAMILSAAMLLDHVGEGLSAGRIRAAVSAVVREGKVRTYDMLRLRGSPDVLRQGAASTQQMTDAVLARIERPE